MSILVSRTNPGAKPEKETATRPAGSDPNTAIYSEESLVGYRWFDTRKTPVMYPFGHGLSYTAFEYSRLSANKDTYGRNDTITLSFNLKNAGAVAAEEVVQVYIHRINPSVEWPYKELKAFSRVALDRGESKVVALQIPVKSLQYWNEKLHAWSDDLCDIEILVGASAGDIKLKKTVHLK